MSSPCQRGRPREQRSSRRQCQVDPLSGMSLRCSTEALHLDTRTARPIYLRHNLLIRELHPDYGLVLLTYATSRTRGIATAQTSVCSLEAIEALRKDEVFREDASFVEHS